METITKFHSTFRRLNRQNVLKQKSKQQAVKEFKKPSKKFNDGSDAENSQSNFYIRDKNDEGKKTVVKSTSCSNESVRGKDIPGKNKRKNLPSFLKASTQQSQSSSSKMSSSQLNSTGSQEAMYLEENGFFN